MFIFSCYLFLIISRIDAASNKSTVADAVTTQLLEVEQAISNVGLYVKDDLLQIGNTIEVLGKNILGDRNNFKIDDMDIRNWSEETSLVICEDLCSKYPKDYKNCMDTYKAAPEAFRGCTFVPPSIQRFYPQYTYNT